MEIKQLLHKSILYRKTIITMIKNAKTGHTGGSLSSVDIINVLYNRVMDIEPGNFSDVCRDHYIQSKGHSVEALYVVLADKGFFSRAKLNTFSKFKSEFVGHPTRKVKGIEHNTGALGHGLPVAVGLAIGLKKSKLPYHIFTLLGDGELEEGSNWEASLTASKYGLDNLIVIVDRNRLQISGSTEEVSCLEPLEAKFSSFGYCVKNVNGNNVSDLVNVFSQIPFELGKPNLVIAHTTKGKGISFIEGALDWHHHVPSDAQYEQAMDELNTAESNWERIHETR